MDRLLELSSMAAKQTMFAQAVNTNNLANISTPGFRKDLVAFSGTNASAEQKTTIDASSGVVSTTGRNLDIAVSDQGWLAIAAPDGSEAYSRRGDLRVDAFGQLTDGAGNAVLGNGGPIAVNDFSNIEISDQGFISITPRGGDATEQQTIDQLKLVTLNAADLAKGADGLLRLRNNQVADQDPTVRVQSGALEASNVSSVEALVRMMDLARKYESQVKIMQHADQDQQALDSILKFS
ncbi:MAG: flagellar basal body rod protein FlgF [Gammaproteobacteria bacterium]|nr:flagellar basal body rod protein FlgF [Gammaproteobacteria bacterium]MBT7880343.1 flagellar basal body rod protein FlgF [Gammaproteobacteria bacterium]